MNSPSHKELAYFAMLEYLKAYYKRGKSDEIGGMLGAMHFIADGGTADAACWQDWEQAYATAIQKAKKDYFLKLN